MQNQVRKTLLLVSMFCVNWLNAQDSTSVRQDSLKIGVKSNPVYFYEIYIGFGGGRAPGWTAGATVNYQFSRTDLLTARVGAFMGYETKLVMIAPVIGLPIYERTERIVDYGLLYGKRWVRGGVSFSISAGVSYVQHEYLQKIDDDYYKREESFIGTPFELNLKFFKNNKRRLRLYYGIIPVTKKKVSFGRSIGLKLVGNISKASYAGFAISYGFGCHKKY
jgi:hypothetical protein